jgi:uncharacterized protein YciI
MRVLLIQKLFVAVVALAVVLMLSDSYEAAREPKAAVAQTAEADKLFIVHFTLGENWNKDKPANEQKYFKHHSENLRSLRAENRLLLGARYAEKGMIVIKAAGMIEARNFVARDSSVINQVFKIDVDEFKPFYDGCISKK